MASAGRERQLALAVVLGLPLLLVLFVDAYLVPIWTFLIGSAPLAALLVWRGGLRWPRSLVLLGAVLFVAGLLLSMVMQGDTRSAAMVTQASRGLFLLWFLYLVALVPTLARGALVWLLFALVLACGINAAINAAIFLGGNPLAAGEGGTRLIPLVGVSRHQWPTTISATYAIMLAGSIALLARPPGRAVWIRAILALAVLALALSLVLTRTRSGYLGALAGLLVVAGFLSRRALLAASAAVAALVLAVLLFTPAMDIILARGGSYRFGVWWAYLAHALENPLIGAGPKRVLLEVGGVELTHAHNLWLSAWVRGGLASFAGMGLMLFGGLWFAWRRAQRTGETAVLAMMTALVVVGLFDYDLYLTPLDWMWLTFWFPIGLAAGCEIAFRDGMAATATIAPPRR